LNSGLDGPGNDKTEEDEVETETEIEDGEIRRDEKIRLHVMQ